MINKPQANEYPDYAANYVGKVDTINVLELLASLQESTWKLFSAMSEERASLPYAPGKWTLKETLGNIIDTERVFAYRALVFSRNNVPQPGFDQDVYINNTDFNSRTIADLANEYKAVRESTLYLFRSFSEEQLLRQGSASGYAVSVRAIVYMTAGHELHHLAILKNYGF